MRLVLSVHTESPPWQDSGERCPAVTQARRSLDDAPLKLVVDMKATLLNGSEAVIAS